MALPWYRVHTIVLNDPGRLLAVHIMHTALVSGDGAYIIDHMQSIDVPREQSIYSCKDKKKIKVIKNAENPLKDYALGKLSIFTINAPDGTPLFVRQFLPINFDSTKKYPVVVFCNKTEDKQE